MQWWQSAVFLFVCLSVSLYKWLSVLVRLAAVDTGVAIWSRYRNPVGQRVAYAAHFAGLVAG